ncbi:MAG: hypothetical protein E6373_02685 [Veillonella sp.]|nr:hypothetical protein [Veillonella sp.]
MDIAHLKSVNKTIGAKQTLKQIAKGAVKYVFLGCDSDERVVQPLRIACPTLILVISDVTLCYDGSIINLKFGKEVPKCQQLIS